MSIHRNPLDASLENVDHLYRSICRRLICVNHVYESMKPGGRKNEKIMEENNGNYFIKLNQPNETDFLHALNILSAMCRDITVKIQFQRKKKGKHSSCLMAVYKLHE